MDNSNNENCCAPNNDSSQKNNGMKKNFGLGILGLALILALTTAFKSANEAPKVSCATTNSTTISIADFKWLKTDKEVAYVVLNGNDTNQNKSIASKVKSIVNELNETDGSADVFVLETNNTNYQDVVSKLSIKETPSVAVLGKSTSVINGANINSTKLIRAYDAVLNGKISCTPTQKATCAGNSKASCDPKAKVSCTPAQKAACAGTKKSN